MKSETIGSIRYLALSALLAVGFHGTAIAQSNFPTAQSNFPTAQSNFQSPTIDYSKGNYTVQMYDAETIALLNAPRPSEGLSQTDTMDNGVRPDEMQKSEVELAEAQAPIQNVSPAPTSAKLTSTSPVSNKGVSPPQPVTEATLVKPRFPIDISAQYTGIDEGVPFIDSPKNCADNLLDIDVRVENVAKTKGLIVADLHNDVKEDFLVWDKVVLRVTAPATEGVVEFCMPLTQPGDYAVVIYHDKDSDRKFDKNFLGIPSEHFGMSQNPKFGLRSPDYEEAAFTVPDNGASITIQLRKASDVL